MTRRTFDDYATKYETIKMDREDGILQLTFHTNGGPMQWESTGAENVPHAEWGNAFDDIAHDPENLVVIMTGTGDVFAGPKAYPGEHPGMLPEEWEGVRWDGTRLLTNLLAIEAPIISAINGPAYRRADAVLLSDIVLATPDATFMDSSHFPQDIVPGDGMHIIMPLLLGINRGRYFLLTGQTLSAQEALSLGLVNELLPRDELLPRAWVLARELRKRSPLVLRYTRLMLTHSLKSQMHDLLGYGLALEGLAYYGPRSKDVSG